MDLNAKRQGQRNLLREKGLRATPARIAILVALGDADGPVSHQELTVKLGDMGLDKSTIFRGLQDLTEVGLLHRLELGDHVWRYETVKEKGPEPVEGGEEHLHPHLLCVDCGSIRCLSQSDISIELSPSLGKVVDVLVKGHCPNCKLPVGS
jgi:Fur family transcriptional regulator, ferric uptake regulator